MSATIAACAESVSPAKPRRAAAPQPNAPQIVHVRFDSFVLYREPAQTPRFRIRVKPIATAELRTILESFTPAVDPDSTHGFFLNFFGSALLQQDLSGTLRRLQLEVLKRTGINVSVGAANSRIAAAVASRIEIPGGIRVIAPGTEAQFLADLPVEVFHGINGMQSRDLRHRGINSLAELQRVPRPALAAIYGNDLAGQIWRNARGLDAEASNARPIISTSGWQWLRLAAANLVAAL